MKSPASRPQEAAQAAQDAQDAVERALAQGLRRLQRHEAIEQVYVAFSGGADSTALLVAAQRLLTATAEQTGSPRLTAVHVNHGLQPAAAAWQRHCAAVCRRLNVPLQVHSVTVSRRGNLEANARRARYAVLTPHLAAGDVLLLGHHQHDQTETILERLFQGRGVLPMRSTGVLGVGRFLRPLLQTSPVALRDYLRELGIDWIEDDSNTDERLSRNFLRRRMLAPLAKHWPGLHAAVARVATAQAAIQQALIAELAQLPHTVPMARLPQGDARLAWLRAFVTSRGATRVSDRALRVFAEQLDNSVHPQLECGASARLYGYDAHLHWVPAAVAVDCDWSTTISPGDVLDLPHGQLRLLQDEGSGPAGFACPERVTVRYRRGGERIRLQGFSKSLKQVFVEARIPPWQRASYPLLFVGEDLVCVPGLAAATSVPSSSQSGLPRGRCRAIWMPREDRPH